MFNLMAGVLIAVGGMVHGMFGFGAGQSGLQGRPGMMPPLQQGSQQEQMMRGDMDGMRGMEMMASTSSTTPGAGMHMGNMSTIGIDVFGTVSAINGTTLTLESHFPAAMGSMMGASSGSMGSAGKGGGMPPRPRMASSTFAPTSPRMMGMMGNATTTFIVDASQAKILIAPGTTTVPLSEIQVGTMVTVQGTVATTSRTSILAKVVIEIPQVPQHMPIMMPQSRFRQPQQQAPQSPQPQQSWWQKLF